VDLSETALSCGGVESSQILGICFSGYTVLVYNLASTGFCDFKDFKACCTLSIFPISKPNNFRITHCSQRYYHNKHWFLQMFSIIQLKFTKSSALIPEVFENFKLYRLPDILHEIQGHVAFVLGLVYLFQA
jgi:hypothetical protein